MISLLKAMMSQDMNLFKIRSKKKSSNINKFLFPIVMALIFMGAIGLYWFSLAVELAPMNLTYIMLTIVMMILVIFTIIEGIYKSQGILFEAKDNDLLFSLPIQKSNIVFGRIFKLLVFQYFYNLLFILPAFVIYIGFEKPGMNFYLVSILMTFLLPIIPTVLACFIGFFVNQIAVNFKAKKFVQTLLTLSLFCGVFYASFHINQVIEYLTSHATNIHDLLTKLYFPVGMYIRLIQSFHWLDLLVLILVNIVFLVGFVAILGKYYFRILSKLSEKGNHAKMKIDFQNGTIKQRNKMTALIIKELKRYLSSTVYMFNTLFSILLMFIGTIAICVNLNGTINMIIEGNDIGMDIGEIVRLLPKIFFGFVIGISGMTSITSSAISIEGKAFNITKSLPVRTDEILLAKIATSNLIDIPVMLISDLIFCVVFQTGIFDTFAIFAITFLMPTFIAMIGLFVNLKYPKMDATSDTEVVKQSMSVMVSMFIGIIWAVLLIGCLIGFSSRFGANTMMIAELLILVVAIILVWKQLKKYGEKRFKEINV